MNYDFRCQSKPGEDGAGPSCQDSACLHFSDGLERQRETLNSLQCKSLALSAALPLCGFGFITQELSLSFSLWGTEFTHCNDFTKSILFRKKRKPNPTRVICTKSVV